MLILMPNDQNLANVLLKHVKTQVQRSKNKSAAIVLLSSTENNEYLLSNSHYVGEEPLNLKYKDSPQIVRLWRLGIFLKYRPLFGGKNTDSDDDTRQIFVWSQVLLNFRLVSLWKNSNI